MAHAFEYDDVVLDDVEEDEVETSDDMRDEEDAAATAAPTADDPSRDPEAARHDSDEESGAGMLDGAEMEATLLGDDEDDGTSKPVESETSNNDVVIGLDVDAPSDVEHGATAFLLEESFGNDSRGFSKFLCDLDPALADAMGWGERGDDERGDNDDDDDFMTTDDIVEIKEEDDVDNVLGESEATATRPEGLPDVTAVVVRQETSSRPEPQDAVMAVTTTTKKQGLGHDWLRRVLDFLQRQASIRRLTAPCDPMKAVEPNKQAVVKVAQDDDDMSTVDDVHYYCQLSLPESDATPGLLTLSPQLRRHKKERRIRAVLHVDPVAALDPADVRVVVTTRDAAARSEMAVPASLLIPVLRPVDAAGAPVGAPLLMPPAVLRPGVGDCHGTVPMRVDSQINSTGAASSAVGPSHVHVPPSVVQTELGMHPGMGTASGPTEDCTNSTVERRWAPWANHRPSDDVDATSHDLASHTGIGTVNSAMPKGTARPQTTAAGSSGSMSTVRGVHGPVWDVPTLAPSNVLPSNAPASPFALESPIKSTETAFHASSLLGHSFRVDPAKPAALGGLKGKENVPQRDSKEAPDSATESSFHPSPLRREEREAVDSPSIDKDRLEAILNTPTANKSVGSPRAGLGTARTNLGSPTMNVDEDTSFPSPDPPTPPPDDMKVDDDWMQHSPAPFRNVGAHGNSPSFPSPDPPTPPRRTDAGDVEECDKSPAPSSPLLGGPGSSSPTGHRQNGSSFVGADVGHLDEQLQHPKADLAAPRVSAQRRSKGPNPRPEALLRTGDPASPSTGPTAPRITDVADEGPSLGRHREKKHKKKKSKKHKRKRSSSNEPSSPQADPLKSLQVDVEPLPPSHVRTDETNPAGGRESDLALWSRSHVFKEAAAGFQDPLSRPRDASQDEVAGSDQRESKRTSELEIGPPVLKGILRTASERRSLSDDDAARLKNGSDGSELTGKGSETGGAVRPHNAFASSDKTTIEVSEPMSPPFKISGENKGTSAIEKSRLTGRVDAASGTMTQRAALLAANCQEDAIVPNENKNVPKRMRLEPTHTLAHQRNRRLPLVWGSTRHFRANIHFEQYRISAPTSLAAHGKQSAVLPVAGKVQARKTNSSGVIESVDPIFNTPSRRFRIQDQSSSTVLPAKGQGFDDQLLAFAGTGPENLQGHQWKVTHHVRSHSSQAAPLKEAPEHLLQSASAGPVSAVAVSQKLTHRMPMPTHPTQSDPNDVKRALAGPPQEAQVPISTADSSGPLSQGPAPVRALCSEKFLSLWEDVVAELGSGRWAALSNANSRLNGAQPPSGRGIELIDTSLVDQCGVDIEVNDLGILLFTASALETSDDAKMVVTSVGRLVVRGRYSRLVIFLSYDTPITDDIARHIAQLQTAALCNGLKFPTDTVFKTTSPRTLSAAIAATVFAKVDARNLPHIDNAAHPSYRLWAGFLLSICPKLCASGALKLLQLSQQVAPSNVNPLSYALKCDQFRRNIQEAIRTKSPTVSSIHPETMTLLEKALLAPLKPH